jgi:prevent-host-death family protein
LAERTIEAADFKKVCLLLLKVMERDGEPIIIAKDGKPSVVLTSVAEE